MPTNLLKEYNALLDWLYADFWENIRSIYRVFARDFIEKAPVLFNGQVVHPLPTDGGEQMERQFEHLTTVVVDKATNKRSFDQQRAIRIHWILHHLMMKKSVNLLLFFVPREQRVYILDRDEKYVIILEKFRKESDFFLLTAYLLEDDSFRKILKRYEREGEIL